MIATDPLSLVFIGCFVVSGTFLILSALLGAGAEDLHFGHFFHGHTGHMGHSGHAAPGHASGVMHHALPHGHAGAHAQGHDGTTQSGHANATQSAQASPSILAIVFGFLNLYAILAFLFWFGLIGYVLRNLTNFGSLAAFWGAVGVGVIGAVLVNMVMSRLMGHDDGALDEDSSDLVGTLATVSLPIRAGGIGEVIYKKGTAGRKSLGARSVDGLAIPRDAEVVIVGYHKGIAQVQSWDSFLSESDPLESGLRTLKKEGESTLTTDVTSSNPAESA
jgi:membrane protein implicated in regulation of membrane protease activity